MCAVLVGLSPTPFLSVWSPEGEGLSKTTQTAAPAARGAPACGEEGQRSPQVSLSTSWEAEMACDIGDRLVSRALQGRVGSVAQREGEWPRFPHSNGVVPP